MNSGWGPLALAALVVLAGCSGFGADREREPTPDRTPFDVPDRSTVDGGPDWTVGSPGADAGEGPAVDGSECRVDSSAAPGEGPAVDPVTSGAQVERTHSRGLSGCSYRATLNRTVHAPDGSVIRATRVQGTFGADGQRYVVRRRHLRDDETLSFRVWSDGGDVHQVHAGRGSGSGSRGSHHLGPPDRNESAESHAAIAERSFNSLVTRAFAATEVVDYGEAQVKGRAPRFLVEARGTIPGDLVPRPFENVSNVSVQAVLDGWGVVRQLEVSYDARFDGRPVTVRTTLEVEDVGNTTVEEPSESG